MGFDGSSTDKSPIRHIEEESQRWWDGEVGFDISFVINLEADDESGVEVTDE